VIPYVVMLCYLCARRCRAGDRRQRPNWSGSAGQSAADTEGCHLLQ